MNVKSLSILITEEEKEKYLTVLEWMNSTWCKIAPITYIEKKTPMKDVYLWEFSHNDPFIFFKFGEIIASLNYETL